MKIKEFIIMPHTADTMGLIHRPPAQAPTTGLVLKIQVITTRQRDRERGRRRCWFIVTKQNATKDVPKFGGEYMNVKKLEIGMGRLQ